MARGATCVGEQNSIASNGTGSQLCAVYLLIVLSTRYYRCFDVHLLVQVSGRTESGHVLRISQNHVPTGFHGSLASYVSQIACLAIVSIGQWQSTI